MKQIPPSHKKHDFERGKMFLGNKLNDPPCISISLMIHTEKLALPFKFDDCECEGLSYKRLNIHMGKQQKTGFQVGGIDGEYVIKDVNLQTDNSLIIILQGKVAEDPDDVAT